MKNLAVVLLCLGGAAISAGVLTAGLLPLLRRRAILDHPGVRSSHTTPTPRGGGVALVVTIFVAWTAIVLLAELPPRFSRILLGLALLAVVSAADDLRDLSPVTRLGWQVVAVVIGISAMGSNQMVFHGLLPLWLDRTITVFAWIWLVNLFNFMDGIDGITSVETASVGMGLAAVVVLGDAPVALAYMAAVVAGAAVGFLPWNWYRARVFLGDVGAVPLGYVVGWLLISVTVQGYWEAALILPLYYLADATITLFRRMLRGERPWEPHRDHFYQVATPPGASHAVTVRKILVADTLLVAFGVASIWVPAAFCLIGAGAVVVALLAVMARGR